jgi:hypothetical protein
MVAVVVIVSNSFSLSNIIPNKSYAATPHASGSAGAIISGRRSPLIRFTAKCAGRVRRSGVRLTLDTGSNIASTTLGKWNVIASGSDAVTKSAAW